MQLTSILLIACALTVSAKTVSQTITYSGKDVSLEKIFRVIKEQTGYLVTYNPEKVKAAEPVDVHVKDEPLNSFLELILKNESLAFSIEGNTIFIREEIKTSTAQPNPPITVRGKIVNEKGEPVIASVIIKGTNRGTTSDANGQFELSDVGEDAILIISATNIETATIRVEGKHRMDIAVKTATSPLDEVQIIAYGTTTRRFNTGNVSTVNGEDLRKQPISDPINGLQGRVAGLYITQTSGLPGSGLNIRLRGQNSLRSTISGSPVDGNQVLYIVDGVPFTSTSLTSPFIGGGAVGSPTNSPAEGLSPFNSLNLSDIESIDVLKDADATAIYGSRGANGVILITTRKGKAGKTKVDVNAYTGFGKVAHRMDLLNTQQYLGMRHEAISNDSLDLASPPFSSPLYQRLFFRDINGMWDTTRYTDWQDLLIGGTAKFNNIQASVSGGDANTQFLLAGGFSGQTTVFPGDFRNNKNSFHLNLSHQSSNRKFSALLSSSFVKDISNLPQVDFTSNIRMAPDAPQVYDSTGKLNWQNNSFTTNPFAQLYKKADASTDNFVNNLSLSYALAAGLEVKTSLGYTQMQMDQRIITPAGSFPPPVDNDPSFRTNNFSLSKNKTWIVEPQISYQRDTRLGLFDILIGSSFQETDFHSLAQSATGFSSDALIGNISAASSVIINGSRDVQYRYNAWFGRLRYHWKDKYLVNLSARRDGSSRFGPGRQFGNFGAVGAGWIFSEENFIKNHHSLLSFGKVRASYGTTGNDQIGDYQYLSTYSSISTTYQGITGLYPTQLTNPGYGWEVVKKLEAGLELGILENKVLFDVSYYRNRTGNQLIGYALPSYTGFTSVQANLPALVQNTGIEIEINTTNIKADHFSWNTSFNISFPRNKLVSYPDIESSSYQYVYVVGESLSAQRLLNYTGINAQTGLYTVADISKDDQITFPDDYTFIQELTPRYFGGLQNKISYKGFQLDVFLQFVKQKASNYLSLFPSLPGFVAQNQPVEVLSRWQQPGDVSTIQRFSTGIVGSADPARSNFLFSNGNIADASFVRLKNVSLSYSLPSRWMEKIAFHSARVYVLGQNLLTFTRYKGLDPENHSMSLPPLRMVTAGIQFSL